VHALRRLRPADDADDARRRPDLRDLALLLSGRGRDRGSRLGGLTRSEPTRSPPMLRRSRSLLLPCAVLCAVSTSGAQSRFCAPTRPRMSVDNGPEYKYAVCDVNGDGLPDLACANMGSTMPGTHNSLYLNDGFGGFRDVTATNPPQLPDWSGAVALGDDD